MEQEYIKQEDMKTKTCGTWCKEKATYSGGGSGGGVYGLAFLGAAFYYIQTATSFWMGVLGILKALVWPALLAYNLFEFLHM